MLALISFACVILLVVSVHEMGHYLAARFFGVGVTRFSVGFGPPLWKRRDKNGTEWVLAPIPLGGYVQMLDDELPRREEFANAKTMNEQSHWKRIIIYAAGPAANILLSVVVMAFLLSGGEVGLRPVVGAVAEGGEAALAGVSSGERLRAVNGRETPLWQHVELALMDAVIAGEDIEISADSGAYHIPKDAATANEIEGGVGRALGMFPQRDFILPRVSAVLPDSPAASGGVREGDEIVMINRSIIDNWRDALTAIQANPGRAVELVLWRDGGGVTLTATLASIASGGQFVGRLGIAPTLEEDKLAAALTTVNYSPAGLFAAAAARAADDVRRTFGFVRLMLGGAVSADNVSGPVGIAAQSGRAAESGFGGWLRFVAIISISLAVLNLLPLPILDGGQILLSVVQWSMRRDLPENFIRLWNAVGAVALLSLMIWTVFNDIMRLL